MSQETKPNIHIIGCGYLGKKLLNALISRNLTSPAMIHCLVRSTASQSQCAQSGVTSIAFDLDLVHSTLPSEINLSEAIIYYFAPPPSQGKTDDRAKQFLKLLTEYLHSTGEKITKIILISTTGVYGNCKGQWVDENTPLNPSVDRALRRADAEQQFQQFCDHTQTTLVILRVSGIYGPGKLPLQRIKAQTPIVREEDSPFSNRIHSDDLLEICLKAGLSHDIEGIFNCADGHPTTMCDYFMKLAKANHLPSPPTITLEQAQTQLSAGMLSYMAESRRINNKKLLTDFNLTLKYPDLDSGLK
ncbi:NAD-dependent epimerase/dehydratase family protein [sulfur-oxidizing endosymbiont of Gigantopelta aegis]|uniref:NAD-dependent epimerase/dehydratase family protein n=1 Tax=sulfur-oxidizing endosymbiont of Gigantopelta aegis TaxID=2794934 RepID=UPI0018DC7EDC|nr:NAD-dependent epimerase/dehydratase family protein [sulfur-oxidizing endosymbiont of Gigantopelta aegis]